MNYLKRLPDTIPEGQVLVHNQVQPAKQLGTRGFRAWLEPAPAGDHLEPCPCAWANEFGPHYRLRGTRALLRRTP